MLLFGRCAAFVRPPAVRSTRRPFRSARSVPSFFHIASSTLGDTLRFCTEFVLNALATLPPSNLRRAPHILNPHGESLIVAGERADDPQGARSYGEPARRAGYKQSCRTCSMPRSRVLREDPRARTRPGCSVVGVPPPSLLRSLRSCRSTRFARIAHEKKNRRAIHLRGQGVQRRRLAGCRQCDVRRSRVPVAQRSGGRARRGCRTRSHAQDRGRRAERGRRHRPRSATRAERQRCERASTSHDAEHAAVRSASDPSRPPFAAGPPSAGDGRWAGQRRSRLDRRSPSAGAPARQTLASATSTPMPCARGSPRAASRSIHGGQPYRSVS